MGAQFNGCDKILVLFSRRWHIDLIDYLPKFASQTDESPETLVRSHLANQSVLPTVAETSETALVMHLRL